MANSERSPVELRSSVVDKSTKRSTFLQDFESELVLNDSSRSLQTNKAIEGSVKIQTNHHIKHWGKTIIQSCDYNIRITCNLIYY